MDPQDLANVLRGMYDDGKDQRRQVVMSLLFGIRYAGEIEACGASVAEIVRTAGLSKGYGTEVGKGCRPAEYVTVRDDRLPGGRT